MLYPPVADLLKDVKSRYLLVNVVAQRARQIAEEAEKYQEELTEKPVTLAIREVAEGKLTATLKEEYAGWIAYVRSHIPDPFPGIGDVIRRQKAEGGLVCVVSHSSAENITRDYQTHFGILPDDIYGWDLPEHQRKPNTYSLEAIMEKYGLSPNALLIIDDMKPAWEMASSAGVEIGFAAWGKVGFPTIAKEMESLCDYSFQTPKELEEFLFD